MQIIDNGASGFATVGDWTLYNGAGYHLDDVLYAAAGSGSSTATWTFTVQPGQSRISTTWYGLPNRASNAPFQVLSGTTPVGSPVLLNQRLTPNDFNDAGSPWEDLGVFTIGGNTLVVRLSDAANEYVFADAIRIERVGELQSLTDGFVGSAIVVIDTPDIETDSSRIARLNQGGDILPFSANESIFAAITPPLVEIRVTSFNALPIANNGISNTTLAPNQRERAIDRSIAQFDWIDSLDLSIVRLKRR